MAVLKMASGPVRNLSSTLHQIRFGFASNSVFGQKFEKIENEGKPNFVVSLSEKKPLRLVNITKLTLQA